ncbi:MAG: hypothetical protein AAFU73_01160 [Planctomycetota bacterium]
MRSTVFATLALLTSAAANAQVTVMASDSFDYPVPGLLNNSNGGLGWDGSWSVLFGGNEVVMFGPGTGPPFPGADSIGGYMGQANGFGRAIRVLDTGPHGDVTDVNGIGRDGATIWISFRSVAYQVFGDHIGGVTLRDISENEGLFIGSPFGTYEWGVDDLSAGGTGVTTTPSDTQNGAFLVARIDFMPGAERVRLYVDPTSEFPIGAAQVDVMVPNFRFRDLSFSSGGSGSAYYWDDITVAKGDGSIGQPFCAANPNSTGSPGSLTILGTGTLAANDIVLEARNGPPGQFGIFVVGRGGVGATTIDEGLLCISGQIGRYQQFSQIRQFDPSGQFNLSIDLTAIPTPATLVSAQPGETWFFQAWHRDLQSVPPFAPTSNFTAGSSFTVQ